MARAAMLMCLVGMVGCGASPGAGSRPADGRDGAGGADACASGTTSLGGNCWAATGTRWRVRADGPGGRYEFDLDLLAAGRARASDHDGASPAIDEWFLDGGRLRVFLSDRFVEYRAPVTNGTVLVGEAVNLRGQRWSFRADRDFGEAACAADEAPLAGACMTVAGTRWTLDGRVVAFLDAGEVAVDAAEASGRWTQSGPALTFSLEAGAPTRVARVEDPSRLEGSFEGEGGSWSATRVVSLPPVMHE